MSQSTIVAKAKSVPQLAPALLEELSADVIAIKDKIGAPSGDFITVGRNKTFKMPGQDAEAPMLSCIVVNWVTVNQYYKGRYDPNNIKPPVCVALGQTPKGMKPFDASPEKQHDDCDSCPQNQWAKDGSGKACKNQRLLAVVPADDPENGPLMLLRVSPTGIKHFDKYVQEITESGAPVPHPVAVVTLIGFDPKVEYPTLRFKSDGPNPHIAAAAGRRKEALNRLLTPPEFSKPAPT